MPENFRLSLLNHELCDTRSKIELGAGKHTGPLKGPTKGEHFSKKISEQGLLLGSPDT